MELQAWNGGMRMATAFEKVMDSRKELVEKVIRLMEEGYHNNRPAWDRLHFTRTIRNPDPSIKAVTGCVWWWPVWKQAIRIPAG